MSVNDNLFFTLSPRSATPVVRFIWSVYREREAAAGKHPYFQEGTFFLRLFELWQVKWLNRHKRPLCPTCTCSLLTRSVCKYSVMHELSSLYCCYRAPQPAFACSNKTQTIKLSGRFSLDLASIAACYRQVGTCKDGRKLWNAPNVSCQFCSCKLAH